MAIAAIIGVVLIGGYLLLVWRTSLLNKDPLQQELAALIVELVDGPPDEGRMTLFWVSVQGRFMRQFITDKATQRSRLAHALSLARSDLTPLQYQIAHRVLKA